MIGASPNVRVFAYTEPVDMRKGFDGLFGLVKTHLGRDPLSGDLFVFVSRNRKRAKVLLWDGTGLCLYAKRLERGQFANLWSGPDKAEIELTAAELQLFMEGSLLVGKVSISPRRMCLNCLTEQGFSETIKHVESDRYSRPGNPQTGRLSP
ncbi:MAG: IS66 family insertion sequence element accessory protein TnpB [bacterium]|nr:IS66 family insertion sequence element accessory protein TnpB [bacterium]